MNVFAAALRLLHTLCLHTKSTSQELLADSGKEIPTQYPYECNRTCVYTVLGNMWAALFMFPSIHTCILIPRFGPASIAIAFIHTYIYASSYVCSS